jgi:hypothetical protein
MRTFVNDERILKSLWHLGISLIGWYELKNHKTLISKVLAIGLISFHADAAICDWLDKPTALQRILMHITKEKQ